MKKTINYRTITQTIIQRDLKEMDDLQKICVHAATYFIKIDYTETSQDAHDKYQNIADITKAMHHLLGLTLTDTKLDGDKVSLKFYVYQRS